MMMMNFAKQATSRHSWELKLFGQLYRFNLSGRPDFLGAPTKSKH